MDKIKNVSKVVGSRYEHALGNMLTYSRTESTHLHCCHVAILTNVMLLQV